MAADGVRVVAAERLEVGECPVFDPAAGTLFAVDIPNGRLWRWDVRDRASDSLDIGEPLGSVALVEGGGFLLATRSGVHVLDDWNGRPRLLCELEPDLPTQCNDGKCAIQCDGQLEPSRFNATAHGPACLGDRFLYGRCSRAGLHCR